MRRLLPLVCLLAACGADAATQQPRRAVPVRALEVAPRELVRTYTELATLRAPASVDVAPEVPGRILALPFDEGDRVEAGDVVVELDATLVAAQTREARARAAQARAGLAEVEARVAASQALVREAEAGRSAAQDAFERRRQLLERQATPLAAFQEARDQLAMAEARVAAAEADLLSTRAMLGGRGAAVEVAEAAVAVAEAALERHTILAPLPGVVVARGADPGAMLAVGQAVLRIEPTDPLRAEVHLPERLAGLVARGDRVDVRTDADALVGRVRLVAPAVAPETRTVKVEVDVDNPDGRLRPGTFARVTFALERRAAALAVPEHAVRRDVDGRASVLVVEGGVARARPVELGLAAGGWVEVRRGLTAGEQVVTLGAATVADGTPVAAATDEVGP